MNNDTHGSEIVKAAPAPVENYQREQAELIRSVIAPDLNDIELAYFLEAAKALRLNPFQRQMYAIVRGSGEKRRLTLQVGIDGYRALAERSLQYGGQVGPWWCGDDEVWHEVWLSKKPPAAARIGIVRRDFAEPLYAVALYTSYAVAENKLWEKMPDVMLAKCAESLALRKAFPAETAGLYTHEEMMQAGGNEELDALAEEYAIAPEIINRYMDVTHITSKQMVAILQNNERVRCELWARTKGITKQQVWAYMVAEKITYAALWDRIVRNGVGIWEQIGGNQ